MLWRELGSSGPEYKQELAGARFNSRLEGCVGNETAESIKEPFGCIVGVLFRRAPRNDLSATLSRQSLNASNDRRRINDKKVVRPVNDGSDCAFLRIAVSMRKTFCAENVG